ncbi:MAG: hypothetical protein KA436_10520 [Oligoflexales bacterium]|nr:hypothetical protein [Oligoflexales bacterium]
MTEKTTYFTPAFEALLVKIADLQEKIAGDEDSALFESLDPLIEEYKETFPPQLTQSLLMLMEAGLIEGCLHNDKEDQLSFSVNAISAPNLDPSDPLVVLFGDAISVVDGDPRKLLPTP